MPILSARPIMGLTDPFPQGWPGMRNCLAGLARSPGVVFPESSLGLAVLAVNHERGSGSLPGQAHRRRAGAGTATEKLVFVFAFLREVVGS